MHLLIRLAPRDLFVNVPPTIWERPTLAFGLDHEAQSSFFFPRNDEVSATRARLFRI